MEKERFVVALDKDDAVLLKSKLEEKGFSSLTDFIRRVVIKKEAKNPVPCKRKPKDAFANVD